MAELHEFLRIAQKTVATFSGIVKRPLVLREGKADKAYAGYSELCVPLTLEGLDYYTTVEHQIAHILFKSDPVAQKRFVARVSQNIKAGATKVAATVEAKPLMDLLNTIINCLDDYRVQELWGRMYEGSLHHLKDMRGRQFFDVTPLASINLAIYIACLSVEVEVSSVTFDKYKPYIVEALAKVKGKDFRSTLVVSRWLLSKLTEELIRQRVAGNNSTDSVGKKRVQALNQLTEQADKIPEKVSELIDDVWDDQGASTEERAESAQTAEMAVACDLDSGMEQLLQKSEEVMESILEEAQKLLTTQNSEESKAEKSCSDKMEFVRGVPDSDFSRIDVDDIYYESVEAKKLRTVFSRLLGRFRTRLASEGAGVDVPAYIGRVLQNSDDPCFIEEHRSLGYSAIILLDRSGSMAGQKSEAVDASSRVLKAAMEFPFVDLEMWGFAGHQNGAMRLFKHHPEDRVFTQKVGLGEWKWTPLHLAIQVAAETLRGRPGEKYLFVLTDGMPSMNPRYDIGRPADLIDTVRNSVQRARKDGIHVTALLLGEEVPQQQGGTKLCFGVPFESMKRMFGLQRFWKATSADKASGVLTSLVTGSLVKHLRRI